MTPRPGDPPALTPPLPGPHAAGRGAGVRLLKQPVTRAGRPGEGRGPGPGGKYKVGNSETPEGQTRKIDKSGAAEV